MYVFCNKYWQMFICRRIDETFFWKKKLFAYMQEQHVHLPLETNKEPTSLIKCYFCLPLNTAYHALCMLFFFFSMLSANTASH